MKHCLLIILIAFTAVSTTYAQRAGGRDRGGFSLGNLTASRDIPDSLLVDTISSKRIIGYRLTPRIGDIYIAEMDTHRLNFPNSTLAEGNSLAVGYLANLGSPAQTKIFSERKEARDFIFADAYDYYITTPTNAYFYDTKIPYTNILYAWAGGSINKEDQLKGVLTTNFGKKVNVGGEMDYIYSRGQYNANGNKLLSYRLFGSYRSDKYDLNAYLSNYNFVNYENGGLADDTFLTDSLNNAQTSSYGSKDLPVLFTNTWNRVRGRQYFLNHRYNLGFYRTFDELDEDGEIFQREVFVPVSSIIHTLEYEDNRRRFTSNYGGLDSIYKHTDNTKWGPLLDNEMDINGMEPNVNDRTSAWNLKNTFALSLREGFQDWVKFGLTAFVSFEKRKFKLPRAIDYLQDGTQNSKDRIPERFDYPQDDIYDEFSTYVGAELAKRQGSLFTFNARGELCIIGDDVGELRVNGDIQTTFPLFRKTASVKATGYINNVTPAFYQRHFHSRYFWWDNSLKNVQQVYIGGEVNLASTGTTLSAGAEFIQNYVYFGSDGIPHQAESNLQVITARLKQDFRYRALGWENEAAYQLSSNDDIIPLPELSVYSNLYLHFRLFQVLTFQIGADIHYHTKYYAPYYEPATQQFQLQPDWREKVKIGNYPQINAYLNMHLKQARFFIMAYNLSSQFVEPKYFSLAHYPTNPMVLKFGISVMFND